MLDVHRPDSPSPSVTPSLALDAVPSLDRSVSTPSSSTTSNSSIRSRQSRLSDGATSFVRRRGYVRPQGTTFADSARNRDSVMSLGSIAHMQYYFARTGLLDGKGAQLAKDTERKRSISNKENLEPAVLCVNELGASSPSMYDSTSSCAPQMLPPTVSTYKVRPSYSEPLPDLPVLRRELKEALQDACKVIEESQKQQTGDETDGFHEIQGLHILDIITLAIRAAKNYYTSHEHPTKLYAIRSERQIRADLYAILEILKRMASRNFRGGMRLDELTGIIVWIESIDKLLKREEQQEQAEAAERELWSWQQDGGWTGRQRQREWLFLRSFDEENPSLPQWPEFSETETLPNDFLRALADGQRLVKLHNTLVKRSKQHFDLIKTWHNDVSKPYRRAENLRYWIKASELRWEIKLDVPVSHIANDKPDDTAWRNFEDAILRWCSGVREHLIEEWRQETRPRKKEPPMLRIEVPDNGREALPDALP
ncbi:hypothetical protein BAUCODRAFT_70825 [Baudoinia panamericana UAMH 10762]|uniref:Calponin-homology (CH) domain-containing protein n=1 Tax=Baudoinia panamericana (strain UAMH 10762) TaxID=717646 RepID=M2NAD2_BAUPA|nr:uncharacterized protein BAUCODRAFT_70825 [Baudoinia panamericana UAMH 10762]EMC96089.1 hypothetical protein BAUCODRAFT_70825 [Baudoinia panamericana UAMH 10762]